MSSPYSSVSITGYNASPPSDDGSQVGSNQLQWSKHTSKIGDPLKTAIEAIDANVQSAFTGIYGQTTAEAAAGITPINFQYVPGHVFRYGAVGDGIADDTAAIHNAAQTGHTVRIPGGGMTYLVTGDDKLFAFPSNNARHAIRVPSNREIIIEPGATVKVDTTSSGNYATFGCYEANDILIHGGGQIIGDLDTHVGTGEQGFGLDIRDCDQVIVADIRVSKCWGDGIYIGSGDPTDDATRSTNCEINNCGSFDNRRQGMSVVGVVDFNVNGGFYRNTSGTDPESGIDFEPDGTQRNLRVNINGVNSTGNEIGLLFIRTDYFTVNGGNFDNAQRNIQFDDSKGVVNGANLSGTPSQGHFFFNDDTDRKDVTVQGCDVHITTGTLLCNYPGSGSNATLGDQVFRENTFHISAAPSTSTMGGNSTGDCKQFINNTLIFESNFVLTNLTSNSFMTFFKSGWEFSGNHIYNRSAVTVSFDGGTGVLGVGSGVDNVAFGPYNEDVTLNGRGAVAFTASDATPSVSYYKLYKTDTGALTITDFDDGAPGQEIRVISKGAVTFDVTGTNLKGGTTDIVTADSDVTHWLCEDGTTWRLLGFMDNSVDNSAGA